MIFRTHSGSTYEIDHPGSRIRRLVGRAEKTLRQTQDGVWQPFVSVSEVRVGLPVFIKWPDGTLPAPREGCTPGTMTSFVEEITEAD